MWTRLKTKTPYSLSLEYSSRLLTWYEKIVSMPGQFDSVALLFFYVHKDDCEIEVLARSSKKGAIGQSTLYSFSSSVFNFDGPN